MRCEVCGFDNPPEEEVCLRCGNRLALPLVKDSSVPLVLLQCPRCGETLPSASAERDIVECPTCGSRVRATAVPAQPTTAPPVTAQKPSFNLAWWQRWPPKELLRGTVIAAEKLPEEAEGIHWAKIVFMLILFANLALWLLIPFLVVLVLGVVFSVLSAEVGCCVLGLLMAPLRWMFQPLVDVVRPERRKLLPVQAWHLDNQAVFHTLGNLAPRNLQPGDRVVVWAQLRRGRPFLAAGWYFDESKGQWQRIQIVERMNQWLWWVGIVLLLVMDVILLLGLGQGSSW